MKLVTGLVIKNEEKKYLKMVMDNITSFSDEVVVLDHMSTDNSMKICESYKNVVRPIPVYKSEWNESKIRSCLLNDWVLKRNPDWILMTDADEVYDDALKLNLPLLMNQNDYLWFSFHFCHFWKSMEYYRVDDRWAPASTEPRMFKNIYKGTNVKYEYKEKKWSCPNIPQSIFDLPGVHTNIRIKHYGYADKDALAKKIAQYDKWIALGDDANQYVHLRKGNPLLLKWKE